MLKEFQRELPMRIAYADPPYIGVAKRYPEKLEVDHRDLVARLETFDGWALSAKSNSLAEILALCRSPQPRVAAWTKTSAAARKNVRPVYGWEPVIFRSARRPPDREILLDWHLTRAQTPNRNEQRVLGQKPESFCFWVFKLLGALPGDEFTDIFPGSGAVGRAWEKFANQIEMAV
jgi:hypothetical protein